MFKVVRKNPSGSKTYAEFLAECLLGPVTKPGELKALFFVFCRQVLRANNSY